MGIFDFLRSKPEPPVRSFAGLCYDVAFFVLPPIAHADPAQVHELWTQAPNFAGGFLFFSAGQRHGMKMGALDDGGRFKSHHGELDATQSYYALEFPPPPPFDPDEMILGPYFAVMVIDRVNRQSEYFVLCQSVEAGTTLRTVRGNGMNINLGPGPTPTLDRVLDAVRERLAATLA